MKVFVGTVTNLTVTATVEGANEHPRMGDAGRGVHGQVGQHADPIPVT